MGSGSFGGGSGSFGGGSGGSGGSGNGGHGRGGGTARDTDSAHGRILQLTKLTEGVNKRPEIANVRATIIKLLHDRTRTAFLRMTLSDAMVTSAYRALLALEAELRGGATVAQSASKISGLTGATLAELAEAICQSAQAADTDERIESIVRRGVSDLLLRTVGNKQDLYYDTLIENLGNNFTGTPLKNTADIFLGALIREAVRRDLLNLSAEARAVIGDASHEIAVRWTDEFIERSRKKGISFREMMETIGADYAIYLECDDE